MKVLRVLAAATLLASSTACGSPAWGEEVQPGGAAEPPAAATQNAGCEAQQALDRMDARTAVPLLPMMADHQKQNMRAHLVAVQEIVAAMSANDFPAIERASQGIGFSDQMARMCTHMGAGAPGFTDQALTFHRTADTIAAAARQGDMAAVTKALGATLQTCTACHASFRQQVVDEATWTRITSMRAGRGQGPPAMGLGHGPRQRRRCADPGSADCPARAPR